MHNPHLKRAACYHVACRHILGKCGQSRAGSPPTHTARCARHLLPAPVKRRRWGRARAPGAASPLVRPPGIPVPAASPPGSRDTCWEAMTFQMPPRGAEQPPACRAEITVCSVLYTGCLGISKPIGGNAKS